MKGPEISPSSASRWLWVVAILLLLMVMRLASLGLYPLMDNTEARYAEIARVMLASGDWVTPWYDTGVPFWGKPPLSFWITAASFGVFGINEFAARLPHFLVALLTGWLVWGWARERSREEAIAAVALLAGASLMVVAAGAVMTDMSLVAGTTLAMCGFWQGLQGSEGQRRRQGWLLFAGLAVGLLAKGPLVLVLAGLPLALWVLVRREAGRVWRGLPWVRGTLMMLALAVPWYALAESHTPGFLNYFLLGEHWHRFITPGWGGDRYGTAHSVPRGSIWPYALLATLPWSVLLLLAAWRWRHRGWSMQVSLRGAEWQYLLLWSLAPLAFFTFAGNILWTYALPSLPPLALLGARWLLLQGPTPQVSRLLAGGLALTSFMFATFVVALNLPQTDSLQTTKRLVEHFDTLNHNASTLIFFPERPYSAAFYSRGQARQVADPAQLAVHLDSRPVFIAVKTSALVYVPPDARRRLQARAQYGEYQLFSAVPATPQQRN